MTVVRHVWATHGVWGFWLGAAPLYMRLGPHTARVLSRSACVGSGGGQLTPEALWHRGPGKLNWVSLLKCDEANLSVGGLAPPAFK